MLFWESIADSDDRAQYYAYLSRFPAGLFADLARLKIAALDRRVGAAPAPAPQPVAVSPVAAPAAPPSPPAAMVQANAAPAVAQVMPAAATTLASMSGADLFASALGQASKPFAAAATVTQAVPAAPALAAVPALTLPARFCSAEARNVFHETVYRNAKAIADENSRKTIDHARAIQTVYDRFAAEHDAPAMPTVARTAAAYQAVAAEAYRESSAIAARHSEVMAVPIGDCD
ncbi:MAG: hypothetical protein C0489_11030 [Candidatus Accumulibacter sp.]|nr:hypothetical protein [Accumulibacter sp.]